MAGLVFTITLSGAVCYESSTCKQKQPIPNIIGWFGTIRRVKISKTRFENLHSSSTGLWKMQITLIKRGGNRGFCVREVRIDALAQDSVWITLCE